MAPLCKVLRSSLVGLLFGLSACVEPFDGSWLTLSMAWPLLAPPPMMGLPPQPQLLPDGEHIEFWAQLQTGRVLRLPAGDAQSSAGFAGFDVRLALEPNDPCMIRELDATDRCKDLGKSGDLAKDCSQEQMGAHLLSADAQTGESQAARELAQQALLLHVRQVVGVTQTIAVAPPGLRGKAPVPLLALVEHDPGGRGGVQGLPLSLENAGNGVDGRTRVDACRAFLGTTEAPKHPRYYLGNPRQLTRPLHGRLFGFFNFCTTPDWPMDRPPPTTCAVVPDLPPQNFGSISFATPEALEDVTALLITRETESMPRGPTLSKVIARGVPLAPQAGGRGVARLALVASGPTGPITIGTASIQSGLQRGAE